MKWFVPGRIEVFGKHTDYAGGKSLLAAIDRGCTVEVTPAESFSARSTAFPDDLIALSPGQSLGLPAGHWGHYIQVALDRLHNDFGSLRPSAITVDSTLPLASGMSSSSALVVGAVLALADFNGFTETDTWKSNILDELELAHYCSCVENGYDYKELQGGKGVGTLGGGEDHTAMLGCVENELTQFSFIPTLRHGSVALPADWSLVVGVSGVRAEKSGAVRDQYNYLSQSTRDLVLAWNNATGRTEQVLAEVLACEDGLEGLRDIVADDLALTKRLKAYANEVEIYIPRAFEALQRGDIKAFGEVARLSHEGADQLLGNQIPETNYLVNSAFDLGSPGASAFGAGFGGSVWALAKTSEAQDFAREWIARYHQHFPDTQPEAIVTRPSSPARRM